MLNKVLFFRTGRKWWLIGLKEFLYDINKGIEAKDWKEQPFEGIGP